MNLFELANWYAKNQDPLPSRIVSARSVGLDGRMSWSREFELWLTAPETVLVDQEAHGRKITRNSDYAYPMRRAIAVASRTTVHPALPDYGQTLRGFSMVGYSLPELASLHAPRWVVMGEPRIAGIHLKRALGACFRAYSLHP